MILNKEGGGESMLKKQGLTHTELSDIERLAVLCNIHEGLDLKLNWDNLRTRSRNETNDFLSYDNGKLVGFLALFCFNPREAEISGMVHPDYRHKGIFSTLFHAAKEECQHRGVPKILLIVEHSSSSGQTFAQELGTSYDHSEHKMVLQEPKLPTPSNEHLQFRSAKVEDAPILARITALAFDMLESEVDWYTENIMDSSSSRHYYVGVLNGSIIGKIDVVFEKQEAIIYGFGVLPQYRGRGYGRQILAQTIQAIVATGQRHVSLEVATENKNALSLYQSCGFLEAGSYDYYAFAVGR